MNKVIRDARISDQPIRMDELDKRLAMAFQSEDAGSDFVSLDELSGRNAAGVAEPVEEEGEAAAEADEETSPEAGEQDPENAGTDGADEGTGQPGEPEAEPPPEEPQEEQPAFSALQVEAMVEERLKEFEERFQAEKEEAYKSGHDDGKAEGIREGQEQSRQEIDRFAKIADDLTRQYEDMYRNTDLSTVDLAMAVAQKIVESAAEHLEAPVLQAVQECLGYLEDKARVVLKVNPEDLDVVRRHRSDWLESLEGLEQLLIEGDEGISRGGCIVETPKGDVDAQVEERLERLRSVLSEAIRTQKET